MGAGFIHPYVPNAAPGPRRRLLQAIGAGDVSDLYAAIPQSLRVEGLLDLPPALPGEQDLRRHLEEIVARNRPCTGAWLNFCGAGCAQHYVPAIVDEIVQRGEFLTAYGGGTYSDHGKNQALFEYPEPDGRAGGHGGGLDPHLRRRRRHRQRCDDGLPHHRPARRPGAGDHERRFTLAAAAASPGPSPAWRPSPASLRAARWTSPTSARRSRARPPRW